MISREAIADLCAELASDRARVDRGLIPLPVPGSPACDEIFLAAWAAFRHVTTLIGHKLIVAESGRERLDPLDAYVRGRDAVPAHVRWAEAESLLRSGEWVPRAATAPMARMRHRAARAKAVVAMA